MLAPDHIAISPPHRSSKRTLLIVDDEPQVIRSLKRILRNEKITLLSAASGAEGLALIQSHHVSVVLSDHMMPEMDGVTFLERVRAYDADIVRLLLTAYASVNNAIDAINRSNIFMYLTKPWDPQTVKNALQRSFEHFDLIKENARLQRLTHQQNDQLRRLNNSLEMRVKKRTRQLEEAVREGVLMLALAAEAKDDDTGEHVQRIQHMTYRICRQMGLSDQEAQKIGFFSMMHDVGKIHIPDAILKKPGGLTAAEWRIMQTHTIVGEKILGNTPFYAIARQIARSHHERVDGQGYPDGLKAEAIPLPARVVALADVYDALTHNRPYKSAWPQDKALEEMQRLAGHQFDPDIFNVFLKVAERDPTQEME